jgi:hypothetical protein
MTDGQRDSLLVGLRAARRRLRYLADEIDAIGLMLSASGLTMQEVLQWMDSLGITNYVAELALRAAVDAEVEGEATYDPHGFALNGHQHEQINSDDTEN